MSDELFDVVRNKHREQLEAAGWREDYSGNAGASYWWTPDGLEKLIEHEAVLRLQRIQKLVERESALRTQETKKE